LTLQNTPPISAATCVAALLVHVEQGDLDALGGQGAGGGFAEARSAPGDDGGDGAIEFHGRFLVACV
jgi:hypothetical protein